MGATKIIFLCLTLRLLFWRRTKISGKFYHLDLHVPSPMMFFVIASRLKSSRLPGLTGPGRPLYLCVRDTRCLFASGLSLRRLRQSPKKHVLIGNAAQTSHLTSPCFFSYSLAQAGTCGRLMYNARPAVVYESREVKEAALEPVSKWPQTKMELPEPVGILN